LLQQKALAKKKLLLPNTVSGWAIKGSPALIIQSRGTYMQSKRQSLIEQGVSMLVGLGIAYLSQLFIFPVLGIQVSHGQNLILLAFFTVVSLIRGYYVRRFFNWYQHKRKWT
jgi:hypothetical protein